MNVSSLSFLFLTGVFLSCPAHSQLRAEAIDEYYEKLVRQESLMDTGKSSLDSNEFRKAHDIYDHAVRNNASEKEAVLGRAAAREGLESYPAAVRDYQKVVLIDPDEARALIGRGKSRYHLGFYKAAIGDFSRVIELEPQNVEAYTLRGHSFVLQQDYASAAGDYSRVLELDPENARVFFNRAKARLSLGERDAAIADFRQAAKLGLQPAADWLKTNGPAR